MHTDRGFVQSEAAQFLQQGRDGTCSALFEPSVAGSAVLGWAGGAASRRPDVFFQRELPGHGGSTLQTGTKRSLQETGAALCHPTLPQPERWAPVQRGATPELMQSTGIYIQLPRRFGTQMEKEAGVSASGKHAGRLPSLERMASPGRTRESAAFLSPTSPKGRQLLLKHTPLLPLFPQGPHLAEGFFAVSCCHVPVSQLGNMEGGSVSLLCNSLPAEPPAPRKGESSSEQPRRHCI